MQIAFNVNWTSVAVYCLLVSIRDQRRRTSRQVTRSRRPLTTSAPKTSVTHTRPKGVVKVSGPRLHSETLATKSSVVVINDKVCG